MTRLDILKQLKEDLQDKLLIANGYDREPIDIQSGSPDINKLMQFPVIGFVMVSDEVDEEYSGDSTRLRVLYIRMYGIDSVSYKEVDNFHNLITSVEKFLMSDDWTYTNETILGDIDTFYGGTNTNEAYFVLDFEVQYVSEV